MAYASDVAKLLADQLNRLVTLNRHQLAGQVANLDFWLAETRHVLDVIDGYPDRFRRLRAAQGRYVSEHQTTAFNLDDPCCTQGPPDPPRRVPATELQDARRRLCEAVGRLLARCRKDGFLDEAAARQASDGLGLALSDAQLRGVV
jgi:hypothetical protein